MDATEATVSETEAPSESGAGSDLHEPVDRAQHRHDKRERILQRLREGRSGPASRAADQSPTTTPSAALAPASGAGDTDEAPSSSLTDEEGASEVDDPDDKKEDRELELRVARLNRELRDARADLLESKKQLQQLDSFKQRVSAAHRDPYAGLQLIQDITGRDFGEWADWIIQNEGEYRSKRKMEDLPADVREELRLAREEREQRQQRERAQAEERQNVEKFTQYKDSAERFLEANRDDYPLVYGVGWGPSQIARTALQSGTRDARKIVDDLEKNLRTELTEALGKPAVLRALIRDDKALADAVRQAFFNNTKPDKSSAAASLRSGPTANAEGPRALTNGVTASDTASPPLSKKEERRRKYAEAFRVQYGMT